MPDDGKCVQQQRSPSGNTRRERGDIRQTEDEHEDGAGIALGSEEIDGSGD